MNLVLITQYLFMVLGLVLLIQLLLSKLITEPAPTIDINHKN